MGSDDRRAAQRRDDAAELAPVGAHAQKKTLIAVERDEAARTAWVAEIATLDPADLLFLDETSTPTTLTPLRARTPRGERAVGRVPRGRWEAVPLVATLTPTGMGPSLVMEGALDGAAFETYVARILVPALRAGQTVILDTLAVHKSARAQELVEAAGCHLRFLPPYSPDLNPIEQAFAKLKQELRRAEARTFTAVADAVTAITAADSRGFYHAAGYDV